MNKIKVAIYEDNDQFREGLELLITLAEQCVLCGSFKNANSITDDIMGMNVDVLLMDIQMPGLNGIEAISLLRRYDREVNIIVLTVFDTNELVFDALQAGANGYILKNTSIEHIVDSIPNPGKFR